MSEIMKQIEELGIVPVVVLNDASDAIPVAKALIEGGLPVAEVTFRTDAAKEAIRLMTNSFPQMLVGAGTVLTVEQVDQAVDAGARFIVSPGFNPKVVRHCIDMNIPVVPGCNDPSAMEAAMELGLDTVKFFPAEQSGGIKAIKAMAAPYTNLKFMPTGGINANNLKDYLSFKKVIACGGSWMVAGDLVKNKQFSRIKELTAEAVKLVKAIRMPEEVDTTAGEAIACGGTGVDGGVACGAGAGGLAGVGVACGAGVSGLTGAGSASCGAGAAADVTCGAGAGTSCAGAFKKMVDITRSKKVVTMGEIMLRLSTPNNERFIQADEFDINYGGGEANVSVSLSNYGFETEYVTALPNNPIGDSAIASLRRYGVGTKYISRSGERVGIYYLETGSAMRASNVVYDRAHSSISEARPEEFDFDEIFKDAGWFHFTGITPAISDSAAELTRLACIAAKKAGVTVSCDLNFRKKLWTSQKAQNVMSELMQYVDVCIGNEEDAEKVLGFKAAATDVTKGELNLKGYEDVFNQMVDAFGFKYVISSLRQSVSASNNGWSACIMDGTSREFYHSKTYTILPIVDRVGGGDSFAAGCICGLLDGKDMKSVLEFGVAASALKHTIPGDFNLVSRAEVEALAGGDGSGRVSR